MNILQICPSHMSYVATLPWEIQKVIIIIISIFTPGSKDPPGLKTKKAKIKMSDGHRSGRSTSRVSCKSTELKRCSMIEMRWNKYEVSLASPL